MKLKHYKQLLDENTNNEMGSIDETKSRYQSFIKCFEFLDTVSSPQILELGTTRSFVGGAFVGCNLNNPKYWNPNDFTKWDFGAGAFTLIFGQKYSLTTVDLIGEHIDRCKVMTASLNISCNYIVANSIEFLTTINNKYDLIYLDTGDMWPIEPTEDLQLQEAKIIIERQLLNPSGLILIDDVLNNTPRKLGNHNNQYGKSTKSLPYLLANGYQILFEGYQYILGAK